MAVSATATAAAADRAGARGFVHRLRPVEGLLLGYVAIVSVVAAVRALDEPRCWWLLVAHALIVVLLGLFTQPGLGSVGRALRELFPLALLVALYAALDVLNAGGVRVWDDVVQRWEAALFGGQISRTWWQRSPSTFWSTVLHGAYLSYYLILSAPALWFGLRRDFAALRRFVFMVMATFFVCYLFFIFLPVAGPYYTFPRPTGPFVDNAMARMVYDALASGSSYGAAFPSSHVAATLAATIAAWRGSRTVGVVLAVPAALLTVSVVYCQMHYAVDAIAGLLVGLGVALMTRRLERGGVTWGS
jgi:membrane-associated phospholipid phosphatase